MYSAEEYDSLKLKYGGFSSWALWDENKPHDTSIIDNNFHELHSRYVLVGLNISRVLDLPPWSNFHDNTHARKLRYACNRTLLRGSYITDLFKDLPEASSGKVKQLITSEVVSKNVSFFIEEMKWDGDLALRQLVTLTTHMEV